MSEKISGIITDFLLRKNVIKEEEKEIYYYGYETLIYSIWQMLLLLVLGIVSGILTTSILTCVRLLSFWLGDVSNAAQKYSHSLFWKKS